MGAIKVKLKDNSKIIVKKMDGNVEAALTDMGIKGKNLILWQMRQGFGKPIRKTSALQQDVRWQVVAKLFGGGAVRIGNTLKYAPYVHEGTYKMPGRPYITAGLSGENHAKQLQKVAEAALKKGF